MSRELLPAHLLHMYEVHEYKHACAIMKEDFPVEWEEMINVLSNFRLMKTDILQAGGRKSPISEKIDGELYRLGWLEKQFDTKLTIDDVTYETPTHKVDCFKNRIALDIEWNNKDPFFDRDLNNFRLLYERDAISVGVIVTRCSDLQDIFAQLGKGSSYGSSTTHMRKLLPRIAGGGAGGCPVLVFGISKNLYIDDQESGTHLNYDKKYVVGSLLSRGIFYQVERPFSITEAEFFLNEVQALIPDRDFAIATEEVYGGDTMLAIYDKNRFTQEEVQTKVFKNFQD